MDYFQKLNLEETFSRTSHIFTRKWAVFLAITVMAYVTYFAASIVTIFVLAPMIDYNNGNGYSDPHTVAAMLIDAAVFYAVMCIADGAIIRAVTEMYVGQVPTVDGTLQHGLSKLYPLFCNAVVVAGAVGVPAILILLFLVWISGGAQVAVMLFNILFLIAVIVVSVVTYHTYPAIMVEDAGIIDSIKRSYELSQGHRCHIFSVLLLFFFAKFILILCCRVIQMKTGTAGAIILEIVKLLINIAFATLGSILQAVVYVSVRVDKEGLTHQVMVTELFGPVDDDGKTSYVAADTNDGDVASPTAAQQQQDQQPTQVDPSKEGSVV